jgi:hypothetical protein
MNKSEKDKKIEKQQKLSLYKIVSTLYFHFVHVAIYMPS